VIHRTHHRDTEAQRKLFCNTLPTQFSEEPIKSQDIYVFIPINVPLHSLL
jgi:hypothetical protein